MDDARAIVQWSHRERAVVEEIDLEKNFALLRDVVYTLWSDWLEKYAEVPEVPNLSTFEAAFLLLSLRQNYHVDLLVKKGGKSQIRET